jgi:hypothetical protein
MKKLEALKIRKVQKEGEKKKEARFMSWKAFFFLAIFSLLIFLCTSKMISQA